MPKKLKNGEFSPAATHVIEKAVALSSSGLTNAEIAVELKRSVGTVAMMLKTDIAKRILKDASADLLAMVPLAIRNVMEALNSDNETIRTQMAVTVLKNFGSLSDKLAVTMEAAPKPVIIQKINGEELILNAMPRENYEDKK